MLAAVVTEAEATLVGVDDGTDSPHLSLPEVAYREALRTPWWWYLAGMAIAAVFAAEFHVADVSLTDWIPWCTLLPLSVVLVWWSGHGSLEISRGEIRIRGAHLPLHYCTGVVALDAGTLRRVVGREGDPAAHLEIRPWIGPGVQLWLDDEDDPTPYWVVSTRHPDAVVAAVRDAL